MSAVWHADDLLNIHLIQNRENPTEEDARRMIDEMNVEWIEQTDEPPQPHEMVTWAASRMHITLASFTFEELEKNYSKRVKQIMTLNDLTNEFETLKEDEEVKDTILRIANCMRSCYECLIESATLYHRMDPMRENRLPKKYDLTSILHRNEEKLSNFQKLMLYFTKILDVNEYRKMDDQCWKQVRNSAGIPTQSWKFDIGLQDFLFKTIKKETCFEQWVYLTNPKDNAENIVRHLVVSEQTEFPLLSVDRHKWSYDDGIYDTETDTFWVYEEQEDWAEQAEAMQTYRRNAGWGDKYVVIPPNGDNMTVKYFAQPFRFRITPDTEETFDPKKIVLPELDTIFKSQNLTDETVEWCLIMLARLFFKVGEKDRWQVVFFIKGVAASGKSTLAKLIRYMYPPNLITTLSSNVEAKFGLSAIYKGLICVCAEVKEDFGLNQADWQSAASGEEISIAIKNKTAIQHLWDTPFFFLGNELPDYKNASGSVDRRIFIIEFNYKIRNGGDPLLFDKLINNIDLFHRKSVRMYLDKVREHGDKDIWCAKPALLSQQIYDFKVNMRSGVDVLFKYINSGIFEFDAEFEMEMDVFKSEYSAYRKENNEEKVRWNRDHYHATFQEKGVAVVKKDIPHGDGTRVISKQMLTGIRRKEEDGDELAL